MLKGLDMSEVERAVSNLKKYINEPGTLAAEDPAGGFGVLKVKNKIHEKGFRSFPKGDKNDIFCAVDGSSACVLDGFSSFQISCVRAGSVTFDGVSQLREEDALSKLHILNLATWSVDGTYSDFFSEIVGVGPDDFPKGLDEATGRIRALIEWGEVRAAVDRLAGGSILAFDGSLWAGIKGSEVLLAEIVRIAKSKGILLCGISKKSALSYMGMPAIPFVHSIGEKVMPDSPWFYPLEVEDSSGKLFGKPYVVAFAPKPRFVFRVDLALPDGLSEEEAFSKLAALCDDPGYYGYPYPLAKVHNTVAFSRTEVENLRHLLEREAAKSGVDMRKWQLTFQDFHDILDGGR